MSIASRRTEDEQGVDRGASWSNRGRPPTLGASLRGYPMLFLLPVILFAAAGVALAVRRPVTYSASTRLNVGTPDTASLATAGFAQAAQVLASSYSREVTSRGVYVSVGKRVGLSPQQVASRVSSSAVPNSPTLYVNATGPTSRDAVTLANAVTSALRARVAADERDNNASGLLAKYQSLQQRANELSSASGRLKGINHSGTRKIPDKQLQKAQLEAQVAQLRAQAQSQRYTAVVSQATGPVLVVLNAATSASSDRRTVIERFGIIGLAAGLVIGAALALATARLMARRTRKW